MLLTLVSSYAVPKQMFAKCGLLRAPNHFYREGKELNTMYWQYPLDIEETHFIERSHPMH